jgi:hypothetical protein
MKTGKVSPKGNPSRRHQASRASAPAQDWPWLDDSNWRLPSGQTLVEFALRAGFLAPFLMEEDPNQRAAARKVRHKRDAELDTTAEPVGEYK